VEFLIHKVIFQCHISLPVDSCTELSYAVVVKYVTLRIVSCGRLIRSAFLSTISNHPGLNLLWKPNFSVLVT